MMHKYYRWIFLGNLLLFLGMINYQIWHKEVVLESGKLVLLDLAPRDPRSLMQGDYMVLRYAETQDYDPDSISARGYAVFQLNENGVGKLIRFQPQRDPLEAENQLIRYYFNENFVSIGAESFFFEEGSADRFDSARYGGLRVTGSGESILTGLYDRNFQLISP